MSYAPATLQAARTYLQARTGLPATALGIVGDPAHGNAGYHVGWDRLRLGYARGDYSVAESPRDANPTDAAMALDIGAFPRLPALSVWLVDQCRRGAPDCADIREVIYSPDGKNVRRFDRLGIRSGGDSSHLRHTHISYFRDSEARSKVAVFRRFFEGGTDVELSDKLAGTPDHPNRTVAEALTDIWQRSQWDVLAIKETVAAIKADLATRPTPVVDLAALAEELREHIPTPREVAAAIIEQMRPQG